ncbi:MAG: metal ABC transporter permease [Armatimonadota bacterium]
MYEFFTALAEHGFLRNALAAGLLASVACGVMGSYVAARRISYIAGGIAHCVLGGIGAARYLQWAYGWEWLDPLYGAVIAALIAAVIIGYVSLNFKQSEDSVISALWAIGMAAGILFIWQTPGYSSDLMSYLFGNILMVSTGDLWLVAGLDILVVAAGLIFYKQLIAICFDEEFARLRGVSVEFFYIFLLCLTALTVVLLVPVVGLVLVIALLSLPVAVANVFSRSIWQVMIVAAGVSALCTSSGLAISYNTDMPAGATTIVIAGALYLAVLIGSGLRTWLRRRNREAADTRRAA